jgi:hypothetical protein
VDDRLEPEHVLAFGVGLQRQPSEMDLKDGEVVHRGLEHGLDAGRSASEVPVRVPLVPEESAETSKRVRVLSTIRLNTSSSWAPERNSKLWEYSTW